jgi:phosphoenolpyruvate carboxylase
MPPSKRLKSNPLLDRSIRNGLPHLGPFDHLQVGPLAAPLEGREQEGANEIELNVDGISADLCNSGRRFNIERKSGSSGLP